MITNLADFKRSCRKGLVVLIRNGYFKVIITFGVVETIVRDFGIEIDSRNLQTIGLVNSFVTKKVNFFECLTHLRSQCTNLC